MIFSLNLPETLDLVVHIVEGRLEDYAGDSRRAPSLHVKLCHSVAADPAAERVSPNHNLKYANLMSFQGYIFWSF